MPSLACTDFGPDRISLHVRRWGHGKAQCLLIHGLGDGSHVWAEVGPRLLPFCTSLAIDLRGHGDSAWDPQSRYGVEAHVADVLQLLDSAGLEDIVLVGHSMGGDIALGVTAARPEKIIGLVLVDFGPTINPEGVARVLADFARSLRNYGSIAEYATWLAARHPLAPLDTLRRIADGALRAGSDGLFRLKADPELVGRWNNIYDMDRRESALWRMLGGIKCPVLVVRGAGSASLHPRTADQMIRVLPRARLFVVDVAGHAVMIDNPGAFAGGIGEFIHEIVTSRRR